MSKKTTAPAAPEPKRPSRSSATVQFPTRPAPIQVIDTAMMHLAESEVMQAYTHNLCGLWSGDAGIGKTTTARWLVARMNSAYANHVENAFQAVYYEAGRFHGQNDSTMAILGLSAAVAKAPLAAALWRGKPAQSLAALVLSQIQTRAIGTVFIDEAQRLSNRAIDGLMQVHNAGTQSGGAPFTIIFIGLGDLASRIRKEATLGRRINSFVHFKCFTMGEFARLLRTRPTLAHLDLSKDADRDLVKTCHDEWMGNPGDLWPIVLRAEDLARRAHKPLDLGAVLAVNQLQREVEDEITRGEARGFVPQRKSKGKRKRAA